jgi:hypothetical protein
MNGKRAALLLERERGATEAGNTITRGPGLFKSGLALPKVNLTFKGNLPTACLKIWKYFFGNFVWVSSSFLL